MQYVARNSKTEFERELGDIAIPANEKQSNGGKIPDNVRSYGYWMRTKQPKRFMTLYNKWVAEKNKQVA